MDKRKKYFLIFDTETSGGFASPLVYDIGYTITDKDGHIYKEYNALVKEVWEDKYLMDTAYYSDKVPQYEKEVEKGLQVKTWKNIIDDMKEDIETYHVRAIGAYNIGFDLRAIKATSKKYNSVELVDFVNNYEIIDLWTMATLTIMKDENYIPFCVENGFYSEARNVKTNAEVCYSFITNNPTFIEDHTALSDAKIETFILSKIFETGKKTRTYEHAPYRFVNNKTKKPTIIKMIAEKESSL